MIHGDDSRDWVHNVVGKRNIIRINAYGDPVPQNSAQELFI